MNEDEAKVAEQVYAAIQRHSNYSERSMQSKDFKVGVSDLGFCSEYSRRMLAGIEPEFETDALAAFVGTAVGSAVEEAILPVWPTAICQSEVVVELVGDSGRTYNLPGHPDIVLPEGKVYDVKTVNGLDIVRRTGPKLSQQFQRHCYAKAAYDAGLFNEDVHLEEVIVGNIWVDRSGAQTKPHIQQETYSHEVVQDAGFWLDEVVWAYLHEQEAQKEPSREFCAVWCGHYNTCRAQDTDVEGLLTDEDVIAAVEMQNEAAELEKRAKRLKAQAKGALTGVAGSTGEYAIRWVWVNGGEVSYTRQGYSRLDIRKVK